MEDKNLQNVENENAEKETEFVRNDDYTGAKESAVVIEEENRTVLLTEDETIVIDKEKPFQIVPRNRPRKIYAGMWGRTEIATVGLATLAIISVLVLYLFFVLPEKKLLDQNRAKRDTLEQELITAKKKYGDITDTETQVAKLMTSVDDFETRFLPAEITGSTALYQRLNALISAYGLTNSSGPDYRPLEVSEAERRRGSDDQSGGREKLKSIFPGVFVTVTVEGSYQNLRGFIREIETSDQFILINSVQLEPAETEDDSKPTATTVTTIQQNPNDPNAPAVRTTNVVRKNENRGRTRGQTVSLRLEMAAYFRRPINAVVEPIAQPTPNAKTGN